MSDITGIKDDYMYSTPEDAIHALEMKVTAYQKGVEDGKENPKKTPLETWGRCPSSQIENFVNEVISSQPNENRYEVYEWFIGEIMRIWREDSEYYL